MSIDISPLTTNSPYLTDITRSVWETSIKTQEHQRFFCQMASAAIDSIVEGAYVNFDAQTTSNCCHGLSLFTRELIFSVQRDSLLQLREDLEFNIKAFDVCDNHQLPQGLLKTLPNELIDLTSLYVLTLIIDIDPFRGRMTVPIKLKQYGDLKTGFCKAIVKKLQKTFSNFIAESYQTLFGDFEEKKWLAGSSIQEWRKYVKDHRIRKSQREVKYASCLFSMQVALCYLSYSGATIALVNDLLNPANLEVKGRYIRFLKGEGSRGFSLIDKDDFLGDKMAPVIVFGGYNHCNALDMNALSFKMEPWVHQFAHLVLACDTYYPQFPAVADDPNFDSSPIVPEEEILKNMIHTHSKIRGVSAQDASLFCLSHIFVSSYDAVLSSKNGRNLWSIPPCYIPCGVTTLS